MTALVGFRQNIVVEKTALKGYRAMICQKNQTCCLTLLFDYWFQNLVFITKNIEKMDLFYMLIAGGLSLVGMVVSGRLKSKFAHYAQFGLRANMTGAEVAAAMLRHYGISDVKVTQGQGFLSDHYNPMTKTVNLSPDVYEGRSISAAAVAAHECGHAVQHAMPMLG